MRYAHAAYSERPPIFSYERKDCAVRAVRVVLCLTYPEAHAALKAAGRLDKDGTPPTVTDKVMAPHGFKRMDIARDGCPAWAAKSYPTLAQFAAAHPVGRYVLSVHRHAIALVNGVVCDYANKAGPRSRVRRAWGRI